MSFTSKWNLITFAPAYPRSSYPFPYFSRPSVYPISSSLSLFSLPLSSLFLFAGPPCFSIFFDHLCSSLLPSSPPLVTFRVKTHREVFTLEWKYLNFAASSSGNYCSRRFVRLQLRAHFSSAIPSVIPARITSIPLPPYLSFRAVYSASKYSNAVAIISFRLGLSRASSSGGESISFFLLVILGRGNCLLSFEIVALLPFCCLISWLISRSPFVLIPSEKQVPRRVSLSLHRSMKMPKGAANYELHGSLKWWCTKCLRLPHYLFFISRPF